MGLLPRWAWLWSPGTDSQHPMYQEFHAKRTTGKLEETLREKLENMKNNAQKLKAQKQMTQKLSQKSQGPKQVDAKVEKTESKENILSGLATFAPTLQVFWSSCNNWGQKTSVHSLHFCYLSTFVSTFLWPLNLCVVQLNFFWPFNLCANSF